MFWHADCKIPIIRLNQNLRTMKKLILLVAGLAIFGGESIAQGHHDKGKHSHSTYKEPKGNAYGHYKNKEVYASRPNTRVYVSVNPGIRYVRTVTVAPRSYVYVEAYRGSSSYRSRVMSAQEVENLAHEMEHLAYDHERLDLAKAYIRKDMVYAEDIAYLMEQLRFEDHRLELAKFGYRRTVDKRNYNVVFDRLEYKGSVRELDRYIHEY